MRIALVQFFVWSWMAVGVVFADHPIESYRGWKLVERQNECYRTETYQHVDQAKLILKNKNIVITQKTIVPNGNRATLTGTLPYGNAPVSLWYDKAVHIISINIGGNILKIFGYGYDGLKKRTTTQNATMISSEYNSDNEVIDYHQELLGLFFERGPFVELWKNESNETQQPVATLIEAAFLDQLELRDNDQLNFLDADWNSLPERGYPTWQNTNGMNRPLRLNFFAQSNHQIEFQDVDFMFQQNFRAYQQEVGETVSNMGGKIKRLKKLLDFEHQSSVLTIDCIKIHLDSMFINEKVEVVKTL